MAYKLAEEDKLCGVIYPTYEGFSPIPKATCDMLNPQCNDIEIVLNCDKKKEEEKPTPEPTPQPNPVEPTPEPEPAPKPVLTNEELDTIVSGKLSTNTHLGNYMVNQDNIITLIGEATPEDIEAYKKEITDKVGDIPELEGYTVEVVVNKINGDNVGNKSTGAPLYTKVVKITKPNGDVYQSEPMSIGTTTETTIDLLEALPRVEDKFSKVITKDGQVVEVPEVSNEDKRSFEDKIINDLKDKLPEGTTVEAVLEGPKYNKGDKIIEGKTNYGLNVKINQLGKVYEHTYSVPHTEEAPQEEPEAPDVERDNLTDELRGLSDDNRLGTLSVEGIDGHFTKATDIQMGIFNANVDKIRKQYPEYTIEYTLHYPEKEPQVNLNGNTYEDKYKYLVKFTITKGDKSTEVPTYIPFTVVYNDHL